MSALGEEHPSFEEPPVLRKPDCDSEGRREATTTAEHVESSSEATPGRLCDPFLSKFAQMMNQDNVSKVLEEQVHMYVVLTRYCDCLIVDAFRMSVFEVTNEKIASVNRISELNYRNTAVDLRQTTRSLATMKRELDSIFRRIRY